MIVRRYILVAFHLQEQVTIDWASDRLQSDVFKDLGYKAHNLMPVSH